MKKLYDVYFTLAEPASMVIAAESEEEAEEILENMSNDELMERITNALAFGIEVEEVECLDDEEEE